MTLKEGRVTIPTNLDVVPETIELMKRWGADAIRDCDVQSFQRNWSEPGQKFMPPIILPGRTTSGQRQTRMKYSSAM